MAKKKVSRGATRKKTGGARGGRSPGVRAKGISAAAFMRAAGREPLRLFYVLSGGEEFLQSEAEAAIARVVLGREPPDAAAPPDTETKFADPSEFSCRLFHGPAAKKDLAVLPLSAVLDEAETYPMFGGGGKKLVVVRGADVWVQEHADALLRYLEAPPDFTVLVLTVGKLDGRSRLARRIVELGGLVDCRPLYESNFGESLPSADSELARWIIRRAVEKGLAVGADEVLMLMEWLGGGLRALDGALDRLSLYLDDEPQVSSQASRVGESAASTPSRPEGHGPEGRGLVRVTAEAIEAVAAQTRQDTVFRLADLVFQPRGRVNVGARGAGRAIVLAERLFDNGLVVGDGKEVRNPQAIALMIFNQLSREHERRLRALAGLAEGRDPAQIAGAIGVPTFRARSFFASVRGLKVESLQRRLEWVFEAELALKTSAQDERILVEGLLARLCAAPDPAASRAS